MAITDYTKTENGYDYIAGADYLHPQYVKYAPYWQKARDILMGEDELKSVGKREKYLPRLSGHTSTLEGNTDYNAFVGYAMLYNATGRTVDAYRGLLNRKLPSVTVPEYALSVIEDFTIKGESIYTFIEQVEVELITTNRVGIFIDHPYTADKPLTLADVTQGHIAPYAVMYPAESIVNWEEKRINNKVVTSMVVLRELDYIRINSMEPEPIYTYRVLELDDAGNYRQVILQPQTLKSAGGSKEVYVVKDIIYPKNKGKLMQQIPFYPVTSQGITWELSKCVIEDLINVNLAHYRDTAFYEKAIAYTASPTPVFSGLNEDTDIIALGSSQAISINMGGTAKYLEYEGKGLDDIANALKAKEALMAILGAKILANTANGIESGEAAMIHRAGEQGILSDIATTVGGAVERAIRIMLRWSGYNVSDRDVAVEITKDYTPIIMDANGVIALGNELQRGHISYQSYIWALQRGEVMPSTRTPMEELELINKSRTGTLLSKDVAVTYLDNTRANAILGREEELIQMQSGSQTMTVAEEV